MTLPSRVEHIPRPSALLSDGGLATVPLWAVTSQTVEQSFHLPAIGSTSSRTVVAAHDDTVRLSGILVGPSRFGFKRGLEMLAEASRRGSAMGAWTGGAVGGLILVTTLTIRTDLYAKSLSFTVDTNRRDTIGVDLTLQHVPRPSLMHALQEFAAVGVGALRDALA